MDKKKIIQIIVIVAAFGGSGFVLYNGLLRNPNAPQQTSWNGAIPGYNAPVASAPKSVGPILPYGGAMDFSIMDKGNFQYDAVRYDEVNTSTEVGIPVSSLIH